MSEVGDDVFTRAGPSKAGLNTSAKRDDGAIFVATRPKYDTRKFPFEVGIGPGISPKAWTATKADRMSPEEAGRKLADIMRMFKIERLDPDICLAFFNALIFCMAVNSSSVLTPDRADFTVAGEKFKFLEVVRYLGSDLRRFFRAYADDTVVILRSVLEHPDQLDAEIRDKRDLIMSVAQDRGLVRYPHLIGDNAEACNALAATEHVAIAAAKQSKLDGLVNAADRLKTSSNPKSFGTFDSTNQEFLEK